MKSLWFERHLPLFVFAVVWLTLAFVPYDLRMPLSTYIVLLGLSSAAALIGSMSAPTLTVLLQDTKTTVREQLNQSGYDIDITSYTGEFTVYAVASLLLVFALPWVDSGEPRAVFTGALFASFAAILVAGVRNVRIYVNIIRRLALDNDGLYIKGMQYNDQIAAISEELTKARRRAPRESTPVDYSKAEKMARTENLHLRASNSMTKAKRQLEYVRSGAYKEKVGRVTWLDGTHLTDDEVYHLELGIVNNHLRISEDLLDNASRIINDLPVQS